MLAGIGWSGGSPLFGLKADGVSVEVVDFLSWSVAPPATAFGVAAADVSASHL